MVIYIVAKKFWWFGEPHLEVVSPNVGSWPLFKPVKLNLASISSKSKFLVDCFWSYQFFPRKTTINLLRARSRLYSIGFGDCSGTN